MEQDTTEDTRPKARILIVEDERPLILLVRRTLSKLNFEVIGEITVDAGLRRLEKEHFDALLVDYMLPEKSGLDLIHALGDRIHSLPVVMLTGYTDVQLAVDVMRAGAADYMVKDARLEFIRELPKLLTDLIERYSLRRDNQVLRDEVEKKRVALENAEERSGSIERSFFQRMQRLHTEVVQPLADLRRRLDACDGVPEDLRRDLEVVAGVAEEIFEGA